ncbi:MAG: hypothetical protein ACKPKO_13865, partial [Candidatus Fonsibacter sp.]
MADMADENIHIEDNEEVAKRPRGRPKKEKPPQEPAEPRKRVSLSKNKPPKEKRPRGRPRIYDIGTILNPLDLDYFKKYETVIKEKRNAIRL